MIGAKPEIILALDGSRQDALKHAEKFAGRVWGYKIHSLLDLHGLAIVRELRQYGRVFVDHKLHDTPDTVRRRAAVFADAGVDFITVHAPGGNMMLKAAVEATEGSGTKVVAIGLLTSLSENKGRELFVSPGSESIKPILVKFVVDVLNMKVHGFVGAARDFERIATSYNLPPHFSRIVPAIRLPESPQNDQERVSTPKEARKAGASHIVVGRIVTATKDPLRALEQVMVACEEG